MPVPETVEHCKEYADDKHRQDDGHDCQIADFPGISYHSVASSKRDKHIVAAPRAKKKARLLGPGVHMIGFGFSGCFYVVPDTPHGYPKQRKLFPGESAYLRLTLMDVLRLRDQRAASGNRCRYLKRKFHQSDANQDRDDDKHYSGFACR